jgi:hypothetical protein
MRWKGSVHACTGERTDEVVAIGSAFEFKINRAESNDRPSQQ